MTLLPHWGFPKNRGYAYKFNLIYFSQNHFLEKLKFLLGPTKKGSRKDPL